LVANDPVEWFVQPYALPGSRLDGSQHLFAGGGARAAKKQGGKISTVERCSRQSVLGDSSRSHTTALIEVTFDNHRQNRIANGEVRRRFCGRETGYHRSGDLCHFF
jgi:hypothetical protein